MSVAIDSAPLVISLNIEPAAEVMEFMTNEANV